MSGSSDLVAGVGGTEKGECSGCPLESRVVETVDVIEEFLVYFVRGEKVGLDHTSETGEDEVGEGSAVRVQARTLENCGGSEVTPVLTLGEEL